MEKQLPFTGILSNKVEENPESNSVTAMGHHLPEKVRMRLVGLGVSFLVVFLQKSECRYTYRKYRESELMFSENNMLARSYQEDLKHSCEKYKPLYNKWWNEKDDNNLCWEWRSEVKWCDQRSAQRRKGISPDDRVDDIVCQSLKANMCECMQG